MMSATSTSASTSTSSCPTTLFDSFVAADNVESVFAIFDRISTVLQLDPLDRTNLYNRLKQSLRSWKAQKLWALLDKRAGQKEYCQQKACRRIRALVIGAGPCGLRMAIELALLGTTVVCVEKRDRFSRNNVLHLWPFVISDLRNLGAKIFYPKFCAGSIDHISIRQLQILLLKVALVLGVHVCVGVNFEGLFSPEIQGDSVSGWRGNYDPQDHYLSEYRFDAIVAADGKRNSLPGFPKREMRGKLALGVTANFVNSRSHEEERVEEISGVAFIFNQQFFKDMREETNIDLENIVYYKDETHYFVMCAKKQSLLDKGVLLRDYDDVSQLLSASNISQSSLLSFAREAADFATGGQLPSLDYASNHNGQPDVAMFDFTSLFSAENASRIFERNNDRLLAAVVGDSLHEPFWPTGSGCARGFLGVFDTAWMVRNYAVGHLSALELIGQRELAFRLLAQSTPETLDKNTHKYTIDPATRYRSLSLANLKVEQFIRLVDCEAPMDCNWSEPLCADPLHLAGGKIEVDFEKVIAVLQFFQSLVPNGKSNIRNVEQLMDTQILRCCLSRFLKSADFGVECDSLESLLCLISTELQLESPKKTICRANFLQFLYNLALRGRKMLCSSPNSAILLRRKRKSPRSATSCNSTTTTTRRPMEIELFDEENTPTNAQVEEILREWENEDLEKENRRRKTENPPAFPDFERTKRREKLGNRTKELQKMVFESDGDGASKYTTKRPGFIEKLKPERVATVEFLVTGEKERKKREEQLKQKRREASVRTRKIEEREIEEMEERLMLTGMGMLYNKDLDKAKVMSSLDEKIMRTKVSETRKLAQQGFVGSRNRFEDIDERLKQAENKIKTAELSGKTAVSSLIEKHSLSSTSGSSSPIGSPSRKGPPPLVPPKKPVQLAAEQSESPAERTSNFVEQQQRVRCSVCLESVYLAEKVSVEGAAFHGRCFRCAYCAQPLTAHNFRRERTIPSGPTRLYYCRAHFQLPTGVKLAQERNKSPQKRNFCQLMSPASLLNSTVEKLAKKQQQLVGHSTETDGERIAPERVEYEIGPPTTAVLSPTEQLAEQQQQTQFEPPKNRRISPLVPQGSAEFDFGGSTTSSAASSEFDSEIDYDDDSEEEELSEDELDELERRLLQDVAPFTRNKAEILAEAFRKRKTDSAVEKKSSVKKKEQVVRFRENSSQRPRLKSDDGLLAESLHPPLDHRRSAPALGAKIRASRRDQQREDYGQDCESTSTSSIEKWHFSPGKTAEPAQSPNSVDVIPKTSFLAKLFSPKKQQKQAQSPQLKVPTTVVGNSESTKETGLLSKLGAIRYRKRRSRSLGKDASSPCGDHEECGVKSSDNLPRNMRASISETSVTEIIPSKATTTTVAAEESVTEKGVRRVERAAERIFHQKEQSRLLEAHELQRNLEHVDGKLMEIERNGKALEERLAGDAENKWVLEEWLLLVREGERTRSRRETLELRLRELELQQEHARLQAKLRTLYIGGALVDLQQEQRLLKEMLEVVSQRDTLCARVGAKKESETSVDQDRISIGHLVQQRGWNFANFEPVFGGKT